MIPAAGFQRFMRTMATLRRKLLREADRTRWTDTKSFSPEWSERTKIIAGLIPKGSRVIEFGAGMRQLQTYLDPSCAYVSSDLISRGQDTLIVDLEKRPLPALQDGQFDVAVFAGVLEYLSDVPAVLSWICQHVTACIFSYECAPGAGRMYGRLKQTWVRASLGWVNGYTEEDLKSILARAGFFCAARTLWNAQDGSEPIFVFRKKRQSVGEDFGAHSIRPGTPLSICLRNRIRPVE